MTNDEFLLRLRTDFEFYCRVCLKIKTKDGGIEPLILNRAQLYIHSRLEDQLRRTGMVRAQILKGRQQGASTYIAGRFYWHATGNKGVNVAILTHLQDATDNLFGMVSRYHEKCPDVVRPAIKTDSAKELTFAKLDSGYSVATAGSKAVGRSRTIQRLHGSEAAFWPNPEDHMTGIGQAVPTAPGSEVILETTANGIGNFFHKRWQLAERGESDYENIFVPWFWQDEYRTKPAPGFRMSEDEDKLAEAFNLDVEQIAWRRKKINDDFSGDDTRFQQEYPNTAAEAFVAVDSDPYIGTKLVVTARKTKAPEQDAALIVGVDPSRFGDDDTAIIRRRGRKMYKPERIKKRDTMHIVGVVARIIKDEKPDQVFIDIGGLGAGIYDRLVELNFGRVVTAVNFGGKPINDVKYSNKRAEMWGEMREWLIDEPSEIPDDDAFHGELIGPQYSYDSLGRVKLEKKEDMRKRGVSSPDMGDAGALTFAYPVQQKHNREDRVTRILADRNHGSSMAA